MYHSIGYAWQIAVCSKCSSHIGWKFISVGNRNLRPRIFFGLSCKSLVVCPEGKIEDEEQQQRQQQHQSGTDDDDDSSD